MVKKSRKVKSAKTKPRPLKKTKKSVARKVAKKVAEKKIGSVKHYFNKLRVGVVRFGGIVTVGEEIRIKGVTTDFKMKIKSMQINHRPIARTKAKQLVGLKMAKRVREGDLIYKI